MVKIFLSGIETVVATQVQLEPTSATARARGIVPGISKYTGVMQAAKLIVQEEGVRVRKD